MICYPILATILYYTKLDETRLYYTQDETRHLDSTRIPVYSILYLNDTILPDCYSSLLYMTCAGSNIPKP